MKIKILFSSLIIFFVFIFSIIVKSNDVIDKPNQNKLLTIVYKKNIEIKNISFDNGLTLYLY